MPSDRKPKVAHLTSVHNPSDTRIAFRECFSLAQAGYDVVLIAAGQPASLPAGVRFVGVRKPRNRFERMTATIWNIYRAAVREQADVYHFHDPELMAVGLALRARGARVVFDVHEDIPKDMLEKPWIPAPLRRPVALASEIVLRALQRSYSAIVTATPETAELFRAGNTVVVCNYPRIEELRPREVPAFAERPRAAVYLGDISQLRCIEEMVGAMGSPHLTPDIRLALAGTFESEQVEKNVRAMPGFRRVDYLGYCPRPQVASVLARGRAGLLLFRPADYLKDAMPTKLFEYLGSGIPVIISECLPCNDLVRQHDCGVVVNQGDVDDIAKAISFLVDNPEIAHAMGERGRALITERYQWSTEAAKLTTLYAQIA
jgi:glycosyltransferase involved in cell wall biosynthesis